MKILALECSAGPASAAIITDGNVTAHSFVNVKLTHSQTLLPMLEALLSASKTELDEIEGIAVTNGPGSFTGIRIGISAVKGLAMPRSLPCAGVSTLLAMAYNYRDTDCTLCAVMDARRSQVYNALFDISGGKITRLCEDRALLCEELAENLKKMSQNGGKRVIIVGDGTEVFYPFVKDLPQVTLSSPERRFQNAVSAAFAAEEIFASGAALPPEKILPVYLRLPQAERELRKKEVSL